MPNGSMDRPALRGAPLLTAVLCALMAASCAAHRPPPEEDGLEPGGQILTRQDILEMGARDAMQAVERAATHLKIQHTRAGTPVKITQRGVGSFILNSEILVVVDGTRVNTVVQHLENIPAESIEFIQILTGREAAARFGSDAGNGVILVKTSAGR